jgi:short-subunit dehydrogenase
VRAVLPGMLARGSGTIIGIGSVAGDRGRLSNYVYGAAKAGFHTYLAGLRNRMGRSGVHVMTVKPGFVDTAMTWGIDGMFLVASPQDVADTITDVKKHRKSPEHHEIFDPWRFQKNHGLFKKFRVPDYGNKPAKQYYQTKR